MYWFKIRGVLPAMHKHNPLRTYGVWCERAASLGALVAIGCWFVAKNNEIATLQKEVAQLRAEAAAQIQTFRDTERAKAERDQYVAEILRKDPVAARIMQTKWREKK